jgi:hypothetical protein
MFKLIKTIFFIVSLLTTNIVADTYWVSPTGTSTWANAKSASPLSGTACCLKDTANLKAIDYRQGTYPVIGLLSSGIKPLHDSISFIKYSSDTSVIFEGDFATDMYGLNITDRRYILVDGIKFKDQKRPGTISKGHFNTIKNCSFFRQAETQTAEYSYLGLYVGDTSSNNWLYKDTVYNIGQYGQDQEGGDGIKIGGTASLRDSNNTVENWVLI